MNTEADQARLAMNCLDRMTYQEVADHLGVSRGKVYSWALALGRRKNETRIRQRKAQRETERKAFIEAVMNSSQTADVLDFLDELPDASVDLHATSIPYNIGKPYGGHGARTDRKAHHFYLGWMLQVFSRMARTLREGGVAFLNMGSTKDDHGSLRPLDTVFLEYLLQMGLQFESRVVW